MPRYHISPSISCDDDVGVFMRMLVFSVDRKETAAGLDPETEAKESGFPNLSRA